MNSSETTPFVPIWISPQHVGLLVKVRWPAGNCMGMKPRFAHLGEYRTHPDGSVLSCSVRTGAGSPALHSPQIQQMIPLAGYSAAAFKDARDVCQIESKRAAEMACDIGSPYKTDSEILGYAKLARVLSLRAWMFGVLHSEAAGGRQLHAQHVATLTEGTELESAEVAL